MTTQTQPRFVLQPDLMVALGSITPAAPNALSTLSAEAVPDEMRHRLVAAGVVDQSGSVAPGFDLILRTLAAPTGVAHVRLTGGSSIIEFQVYASGNGTVSAITAVEGLEVTSPAEVTQATRTLAEHLGFGLLSSLTIALELPVTDAFVFAAIVDNYRRRQLEALLYESPKGIGSVDAADIRVLLARPTGHPQWMVSVLSMMTGIEPTEVAQNTETAIGRFSADVVAAAEQLATRFSVIDKVLTLTSAAFGPQGEPVVSQIGCLQAGVHDLLVIEHGADGVGFVTLPSAMVLSRIAAILEDPAGELSGAATTAVVASDVAQFCPTCGAKYMAGAGFCTGCGAARH